MQAVLLGELLRLQEIEEALGLTPTNQTMQAGLCGAQRYMQ